METKATPVLHAPGPWKAKKDENTHQIWDITAEDGKVHVCALYGIRDIPQGAHDIETETTAKLIEQAPEMYDILEEILSEWERDWASDEPRQLDSLELRLQQVIQAINPWRWSRNV